MEFKDLYLSELFREINNISNKEIENIINLIIKTVKKNKIFICGNGGSYAIANHALCDLVKCVYQDTKIKIKLSSLSNNIELISAISNDISYDEIFSYQLNIDCKKNDLLIAISSSGNSKNIINAINVAKRNGLKVLSFTGFDGGVVKKQSDINININTNNYGISEDSHSILLHLISQKIRIKYGNPKKL
mgnify:FL=1|tara:strand:+ start:14158 stop:14727 length:570 start_codon:yes stop_codon:yes gene_type:complete